MSCGKSFAESSSLKTAFKVLIFVALFVVFLSFLIWIFVRMENLEDVLTQMIAVKELNGRNHSAAHCVAGFEFESAESNVLKWKPDSRYVSKSVLLSHDHTHVIIHREGWFDVRVTLNIDTDHVKLFPRSSRPERIPFSVSILSKLTSGKTGIIKWTRRKMILGSADDVQIFGRLFARQSDTVYVSMKSSYGFDIIFHGYMEVRCN